MMENEFPPNSHTRKEARPARPTETATAEKKEVVRITKSDAIQRKKPLHKKFIEAFRPEDNKGFAEYVLLDMLVPGIKDAIANSATAAIDNALGVGGHRGSSRRGGGGYTSYNRMSSPSRSRGPRDREREEERRPRRGGPEPLEAREIILPSRVEAEEVLDAMVELLSKYDAVTMRDLLSMVGEPWEFTHNDWGWRDLRGARVHLIREGYLLDLPRVEPLD